MSRRYINCHYYYYFRLFLHYFSSLLLDRRQSLLHQQRMSKSWFAKNHVSAEDTKARVQTHAVSAASSITSTCGIYSKHFKQCELLFCQDEIESCILYQDALAFESSTGTSLQDTLTLWMSNYFLPNSCRCQINFIFSMLLLGAKLIFVNLPPGAALCFEPGKRRDPSRALMRVTKYVLEIKKKCKMQTCRGLNSLQVD